METIPDIVGTKETVDLIAVIVTGQGSCWQFLKLEKVLMWNKLMPA